MDFPQDDIYDFSRQLFGEKNDTVGNSENKRTPNVIIWNTRHKVWSVILHVPSARHIFLSDKVVILVKGVCSLGEGRKGWRVKRTRDFGKIFRRRENLRSNAT